MPLRRGRPDSAARKVFRGEYFANWVERDFKINGGFPNFSSGSSWTGESGIGYAQLDRPLGRGRGSLIRPWPSGGPQRPGPVWRQFWEGERRRLGLPPLSREEREEEEEEERVEQEWRQARERERRERERERRERARESGL